MRFEMHHPSIIIAGYLITFSLSGSIVRFFVGGAETGDENGVSGNRRARFRTGTIIGKCENFLTVTFILAGEITGLALIFAAKSLIRKEAMSRNTRYYLGGTLVNFCFSVLMGFLIKVLVQIQ